MQDTLTERLASTVEFAILTMAAATAGVKRSFHDMVGAAPAPQNLASNQTSRVSSPLGTRTRTSRRPSDILETNGSNAVGGPLSRGTYGLSASIVLIGVRGAGKSTLGVLAATAYNRRLVDTDRAFLEATGITAISYRKQKGSAEYQKRHNQVFEDTLKTNSTGSVIVCSFSDLEGGGANLLREFARSHPIIHISRDPEGIQQYLRVWTIERIQEILLASSSLLRSCSNYEFYNLTEIENRSAQDRILSRSNSDSSIDHTSNGSFLTLKRVERDFLRLLRHVLGDYDREPAHHSAYPFSQVDVECRTYTFAVTLEASEIIAHRIDLHEAQIGADCIELVAGQGALDIVSLAFAIVRRETILPIILSVASDIASSQTPRKTLFEMTNHCFRLGPEMCTVDLYLEDSHVKRLCSSKGTSKAIGNSNMRDRPSEGWNDKRCLDTYIRAARLGCDLVKITMPADSVDDVFAVQALQSAVKALHMPPRLIAYSRGSQGRPSRCFNRTLTSVDPPSSSSVPNGDASESDDIITATAITRALFATFVLEPMRFFIYGADVSYSLSPAMHNAAFEACGMSYKCEAHSSENLDDFNKIVRSHDFGGTAVAQPYKTTAVSMMDGLSSHAKAIGAINTVIPVRQLSPDGGIPNELNIIAQRNHRGPVKGLYGFNTDWIGIRACIRRGLSPANTVRPQTSALVCGAGGMARSAIYSLVSLGVRNIFTCNRTFSKAADLAEHYNKLIDAGAMSELIPEYASQTRVQVIESFTSNWPNEARHPTIIVSCIPRQAAGEPPTNFSIPEAWLKSATGGVVLEVRCVIPCSILVLTENAGRI